MRSYTLKYSQQMPISLDEAWDFFSSPLNLAKITPAEMRFIITSDYTEQTKMYEGMLITYKVSPMLGITLDWMTEITHVRDKEYFIDEQRFGPYALWHHEHHFKEIKNGVLMNDRLTYALPFGAIGRLTEKMLVGNQVKKIFDYREKAIVDLFGEYK